MVAGFFFLFFFFLFFFCGLVMSAGGVVAMGTELSMGWALFSL